MANAGATPKVEFFKGTGWQECETFIRSIREAAWKEDKAEDDRWTAYYASLHFSGKALRWHSRLPPDVRRDWPKLEMALLDQWPSPDDDDDDGSAQVSVVPTPAAAPNRSDINLNQLPRRGVLKVTTIKSSTIFYLGKPDMEGKCRLTKIIGEALLVSVDVNVNPHIIQELPIQGQPKRRYSWVGAHWTIPESLIEPGPGNWARIVLIDAITTKSSYDWTASLPRIAAWDISAGGDIVPTWFRGDQKTSLHIFFKEDDPEITIAMDADFYARKYPREVRGRISLQTLD